MTNEPRDRAPGPVHDQISAFLDDELSDEETAFLVRRFERDAEARNQLRRYTAIGCALRGELTTADPDVLRRRITSALHGAVPQQQLAARAPIVQPWRARLVRPFVGVGIAAAVAIAAVIGLRFANEARSPVEGLEATPLQAGQWTEPPSYVVPQDAAESGPVAPPIRLTNYLMRHGEYASGLSRTSVHSNVVGAGESAPPRAAPVVLE
jgi:sigma-E factor negative regulatory protein RseA